MLQNERRKEERLEEGKGMGEERKGKERKKERNEGKRKERGSKDGRNENKRKRDWRMVNGEVGKKELTIEFLFKIELGRMYTYEIPCSPF
jgi:hypothetical protein